MFIAFQVLFAFVVGMAFIGFGVVRLRSAISSRSSRLAPVSLIALGSLALLWFPFVFLHEASCTHNDGYGQYIDCSK